MRAFIVLCLVVVATADKLGYNYHPVDHTNSGLSFVPGSGLGSLGSSSSNEPIFEGPSGSSIDNLRGTGGFDGINGAGSSFDNLRGKGGLSGINGAGPSGGFFGGNTGSVGPSEDSIFAAPSSSVPSQSAPSGELNKQFYTYTANDEEFAAPAGSEQASNYLKQGLRVIFIKGPESNGLENAALALAKNAADDNTAIYVLNKQTDLESLSKKLNALRSESNHKPEVHFVKYRTPEDAANAQSQIQKQYDGLGGNSESIDGGVAPAINFASQAPVRQQAAASSPDNSYLPAAIFRRRFRF